ncbi:MAG TPA: hypothetical protein VD757_02415, partial [Candidatus Nitrosocosmicus sp.]|nr:hypothetical protein [Candidatus Nitrosocosmicus sp.]
LFGIMIFTLCVSLAALSLGLIAAPIAYQFLEYNLINDGGLHIDIDGIQIGGLLGLIGISASPEQEMLVFMLLGVFIGIGSLHLFNMSAYLMGGLLRVMSPAQTND